VALSAEHRANISAGKRGRPLSAEHRANIAAAKRGRVTPEDERRRHSATKRALNPEPGYWAWHFRLRTDLPREECASCGKTGCLLDAALLKSTPLDRIRTDERGRRWSIRLEDYVVLCRSCHKRYDLGSMSEADCDALART
jgi:5-methylcytosine-specific restriction endonuclease McrA